MDSAPAAAAAAARRGRLRGAGWSLPPHACACAGRPPLELKISSLQSELSTNVTELQPAIQVAATLHDSEQGRQPLEGSIWKHLQLASSLISKHKAFDIKALCFDNGICFECQYHDRRIVRVSGYHDHRLGLSSRISTRKKHLDSCHLRCRTSRTMSYVMHVRCRTCDIRHRVEHRTYDVVRATYRI